MTLGEKIKYYRNLRGISQETLGELSEINPATIKKYEYGIRNPKPDQLLKIANALGISIHVFMDFDIETVSDVLTLLFQLDEQVEMNFEMKKDRNGKPVPSSVKLSFKDADINSRLSKYITARNVREEFIADKKSFDSEEDYNASIEAVTSDIEEIKHHLIDSNRIVKKGTQGYTVKTNG